jgi:hypothetical protein
MEVALEQAPIIERDSFWIFPLRISRIETIGTET